MSLMLPYLFLLFYSCGVVELKLGFELNQKDREMKIGLKGLWDKKKMHNFIKILSDLKLELSLRKLCMIILRKPFYFN